MKNKTLILAGLLVASMAFSVGCAGKSAKTTSAAASSAESTAADSTKESASAETSVSSAAASESETAADSSKATEASTAASTESKASAKTSEEVFEAQGTISDIRDMQFVLTTDGGDLLFSFDTKPKGLDTVKEGDMVNVEYTGEINPVDAFTGEVLSVSLYQE